MFKGFSHSTWVSTKIKKFIKDNCSNCLHGYDKNDKYCESCNFKKYKKMIITVSESDVEWDDFNLRIY